MQKTVRPTFAAGISVSVLSLFLGGCSMKPSQPTGFLKGGYGGMTATSSGSLKARIPAPAELAKYSRVLIEPVVFQKHSNAEMKRIDEKEIEELKTYFAEQLRAEFGTRYQVVSGDGGDVLRIRVALTDARGSAAALNLHYATLMTKAGVGGGAMEAEFVDSRSGRQLAAFMDSRMGNPFGYFNGLSPTGHAKQVIRTWSKILRETLDSAHGVRPESKPEAADSRRKSR